jgi:uncharacterized protein
VQPRTHPMEIVMTKQSNAALIRAGYAAFATGDMATLDALFADEIVWSVAGRGPLAGTYKGKEQVFGFFAYTAERSGGTFTADINTLVADDQHVVTLVRHTAARDGRTLDTRDVLIFTIDGDRVTGVDQTSLDLYESDEFWA